MAVLPILTYPNPKLRIQCKPVETFDDALRESVQDLKETLYQSEVNVGLAAPQVDIPLRFFVIDFSEKRDHFQVYINPKILKAEGNQQISEGCLSFPDVFVEVERFETIEVQYQDLDGNVCTKTLTGNDSICFQHECDHLDGILFPDRLSPLKRQRALKRYQKLHKF